MDTKNPALINLDIARTERKGFPEVIYCPGKTPDQIVHVFQELSKSNANILATRADEEQAEYVCRHNPMVRYHPTSATLYIYNDKQIKYKGVIGIVSGGTSDQRAAEEARITAELMGNKIRTFYDVGVAGIHRLMTAIDDINACSVLIVVAGMEGTLPGVVAGLVDKPVLAVPTSNGYGAHFEGLAPLLAMLNSCAEGISVVNIDNGFGAAYQATLINKAGGKL
ncbi:nickel pincer cofactor biosynthesis protein LarB [Pseudomonadota bacterium]